MIKKILLCLAVYGPCALAHADESDWRFYAGVGMSNGGDTIISGTITDTSTNLVKPFTIKAGTATEFRFGADYRIADRFTLQASIGHADAAPMGIDGSLDFKTTPVEILGFVNLTDGLRIGGGLRKTFATMSGTGKTAEWEGLGKYTGSRGSVLEAQYLFSLPDDKSHAQHNVFGVSARVVNESFTHDDVTFGGHHYEIGGAYYY